MPCKTIRLQGVEECRSKVIGALEETASNGVEALVSPSFANVTRQPVDAAWPLLPTIGFGKLSPPLTVTMWLRNGDTIRPLDAGGIRTLLGDADLTMWRVEA
mmetsp:Transcript_58153/g.162117  ORF Transcript_58153/g.162117 Transcript_58153/m.162117 type:complete len:102 (-) Transcript_58153:409-714(-)